MLGEAMTLPEKIWSKLNLAWASFFTVCAVLNIYIAFNFSQETWVNFKVFGLMGLTLAFTVGTIGLLYKHIPQEDEEQNSESSLKESNKE